MQPAVTLNRPLGLRLIFTCCDMEFHQTAHLHQDDSGCSILSFEHVTCGHLATGSLPEAPCAGQRTNTPVSRLPVPLDFYAVRVILEVVFAKTAFLTCFLWAIQHSCFSCVVQSMLDWDFNKWLFALLLGDSQCSKQCGLTSNWLAYFINAIANCLVWGLLK